jgi:hypothetical protein
MTTDREVMQQALEALEQSETWVPDEGFGMLRLEAQRKHEAAIIALKAALEQPEQPCNCRWVGDVQTQQCTLHEAHVDAIHEWAERAKAAEKKLFVLAKPETCKPALQVERADARRGRWMLDKMRHQNCGPHSGWTLDRLYDRLYPGDDAAAAIDAAMKEERGHD